VLRECTGGHYVTAWENTALLAATYVRAHHSREQVLQLLEGCEINSRNWKRSIGPQDVRKPQHWPMCHVVAKKNRGEDLGGVQAPQGNRR
jgi:hypothetical protein